jgi:hypothetical protein
MISLTFFSEVKCIYVTEKLVVETYTVLIFYASLKKNIRKSPVRLLILIYLTTINNADTTELLNGFPCGIWH